MRVRTGMKKVLDFFGFFAAYVNYITKKVAWLIFISFAPIGPYDVVGFVR